MRVLIAAAVVLAMGIAVMAVPFTRQYIAAALRLGVGESAAVEGIVCAGNTNIVVLQLADPSIFYEIWLGDSNIEGFSENTTEYHFGAYTTYVAARENAGMTTYYSYTLVGDDLHCIAAPRLEDIENLIRSIG